jgi:hypothetical protein
MSSAWSNGERRRREGVLAEFAGGSLLHGQVFRGSHLFVGGDRLAGAVQPVVTIFESSARSFPNTESSAA